MVPSEGEAERVLAVVVHANIIRGVLLAREVFSQEARVIPMHLRVVGNERVVYFIEHIVEDGVRLAAPVLDESDLTSAVAQALNEVLRRAERVWVRLESARRAIVLR